MAVPMPSDRGRYVPAESAISTASPAYQAYQILHLGFTVLPIIAGLDKFFHLLVNWSMYLAPIVYQPFRMSADMCMMIIGAIEIVAGLIVAWKPRIGGWIVGFWLWGIVVNLFMHPNHYFDIALRDFGLSLGAFALARLAASFDYRRTMGTTVATNVAASG